jgi:hypothetical protein
MMNVTIGLDCAKEGYRPYANLEGEDFGSDEEVFGKAEELGIETNEVSAAGAAKAGKETKPASRAMVEARVREHLKFRPAPGNRELVIGLPHDDMLTAMREIVGPGGLWNSHVLEGGKPLWVESDSPGLKALLQEHFGTPDAKTGKKTLCAGERPKDWKPVHAPLPPPMPQPPEQHAKKK